MAKDKNNSPDTNMAHVEIIENLAISMRGHLEALNPANAQQNEAKTEAEDYLHLFQVNQIKTCRDVFE